MQAVSFDSSTRSTTPLLWSSSVKDSYSFAASDAVMAAIRRLVICAGVIDIGTTDCAELWSISSARRYKEQRLFSWSSTLNAMASHCSPFQARRADCAAPICIAWRLFTVATPILASIKSLLDLAHAASIDSGLTFFSIALRVACRVQSLRIRANVPSCTAVPYEVGSTAGGGNDGLKR